MLSFEEVRELVPQKYPFLFIDKVVELQKESRIVCLKNISGNESFFAGHFPDFAIMPGVLIIEALAQASIILFKKSFDTEKDKDKVFCWRQRTSVSQSPSFLETNLFWKLMWKRSFPVRQ